MVTSSGNARMAQLADTLWYERRLLEYLLFKLVSANLVLIADDRRFVGPAIAEVDAVMAEIRRAEDQRGDVVGAVAQEWNVPPRSVGLEFLVENAPESLRPTFEDHCMVFMELVGEIEILTRENRRLATVALIENAIANLDTTLGGLGVIGARTNQIETAIARSADDVLTITEQLPSLEDVDIAEAVMDLELQQTAYEASLAAFAQSSQTSLLDFLG